MGPFKRYYDTSTEDTTPSEEPQKPHANVKILKFKVDKKTTDYAFKRQIRVQGQQGKTAVKKRKIPQRAPIPKETLEKYSRGKGVGLEGVRTIVHKTRIKSKEEHVQFAVEQAARYEIMLGESPGLIEADPGETTTQFTQAQIAHAVDITAATKSFDLHLHDFGPYRMRYTRNGRHLLLGGRRGHVAALDWVTKRLHCETNVMESVHDVCWLHIETMFAAAQKEWVHLYDNQGTELHCLKQLNRVLRMEFLPYHFLLATASEMGYLSWLDVSIGEMVKQYNTRMGRLSVLTQNPYNATLCLGTAKGVVSMWAPNCKDPLAKMLCHKSAITALHVDPKGLYMATGGTDHQFKIWDVRKLEGPLQEYHIHSTPTALNFAQNNLLSVATGNVVEVYKDCCRSAAKRAYLRHRFNFPVENMQFCPYEDVLGVSTAKGFTSLLVPGAGEANFDAFEANPFQTKSQRREAEVKSLLEKIPADLITLNPLRIAEVDVPTLRDKVEAKKKLLHLKPTKIEYAPRNKAKGKGGSVKMARNKKIVQETAKKAFIKNMHNVKPDKKEKDKKEAEQPQILDRFLTKKTKIHKR